MSDDPSANPALLPAGLRDLLPPEAETEAWAVENLMDAFAAHGYQRVRPPLVEFEDSLLAGSGGAVAEQIFRVMDVETHRMMGVRADITPQVARIATTRLQDAPRPLRLSYAGTCLRVAGNGLYADRQVTQAGFELIGCDNAAADAEMILVGAEALARLGLPRISFDLTLPPLVPALLDAAGMAGTVRHALVRALDRKDAAAVTAHGGALAATLTDLLLSAGPAEAALQALHAAQLPASARNLAQRLAEVAGLVRARLPGLRLTIDPLEFRGFRYHTGLCATVYALGRHEELGRGGRYVCGDAEPATGLTLFPDALLRTAPPQPGRKRAYVPQASPAEAASALRAQGFATVAALAGGPADKADAASARAEALRLGCTHILWGGAAVPLTAE